MYRLYQFRLQEESEWKLNERVLASEERSLLKFFRIQEDYEWRLNEKEGRKPSLLCSRDKVAGQASCTYNY